MTRRSLTSFNGRLGIRLDESGNSSIAIETPRHYDVMTVILSNVQGGLSASPTPGAGTSTAKVQFTLDRKSAVDADTATWHDWSVGDVNDTGGIAFDSPVSHLRVVASGNVTWRLEVLV